MGNREQPYSGAEWTEGMFSLSLIKSVSFTSEVTSCRTNSSQFQQFLLLTMFSLSALLAFNAKFNYKLINQVNILFLYINLYIYFFLIYKLLYFIIFLYFKYF